LRTRNGAVERDLDTAAVAQLVEAGLLRRSAGQVILTRKGRLLANEVTIRLQIGANEPSTGSR